MEIYGDIVFMGEMSLSETRGEGNLCPLVFMIRLHSLIAHLGFIVFVFSGREGETVNSTHIM